MRDAFYASLVIPRLGIPRLPPGVESASSKLYGIIGYLRHSRTTLVPVSSFGTEGVFVALFFTIPVPTLDRRCLTSCMRATQQTLPCPPSAKQSSDRARPGSFP